MDKFSSDFSFRRIFKCSERRCTNFDSQDQVEKVDVNLEEVSASVPARDGIEYLLGLNEFKPLYLAGEWNDPKTTLRRLSLAVVLPAGVEKGRFRIHIVDNGNILELRVAWPRPLVDVEFLHKQWLDKNIMTTDHPKFSGFNCALKLFRERSSDEVYSVARIPLPFPVHCHIQEKANLGWIGDATKVVYMDLEPAVVEEYSKLNDTDDFIVA
ncbi:hypothetical protein FGB62_65g314 [Gracilaria domingensis]|nr:hypothetical protein FGB62_65g314 [Gracilaria domingensis]